MKLKTIFLCFTMLTVLTAIVGLYFYYDSIKTAALKEDQSVSVSRVQAVNDSISNMISRYQRIALSLSLHRELSSCLMKATSANLDRANQILDLYNASMETDVCYLLNKHGLTLASSNRDKEDSFNGKKYAFRPYFKDAIEGNPSVFMALGITSGRRGIYFSTPVYASGSDVIIGVSVIKENIDKIENDILITHYETPAEQKDIVAITDENGIIFISDRKDLLYHTLWETDTETITRIALSRQFGKGPWDWAGFEKTGPKKVISRSNRNYTMLSVEIEKMPSWKIIHLSDSDHLLSQIKTSFFKATGYILFFIFIIIGSVLFILNYLASRAEKALRESEEKYRSLFNQSAVGIYLHDPEGRILDANHAACRQTGHSKSELLRMDVFDLHPDKNSEHLSKEEILQQWSQWKPDQKIILETEHQRKDGSVFPVEISTGIVSYEERNLILAATKDISDRKQAEEDLSEIFAMSLDMICIADINALTFIKVNPAFTAILGYSEEELLRRSFLDFIHPEDIDSTRHMVEKKLQAGAKVVNFENRYKCKDGRYRWLSWVNHPIPEKGKTYAVAHDITAQKKAKKEIESQNRLMSTLLDNLEVGVFMVAAPSGKPLLANRQAKNLLGRSIMSDAEKSTLADYYQAFKYGTDELYPEDEMPIVQGLMGKTHSVDDMVVVQPDGTQVLLQIFGTPVNDSAGNVVASLVSFSDITERRKAEEDRERLQTQLAQSQKMESVGRLAGGVAHDFNNMLSIIIGNAEMMLEDMDLSSHFRSNLKEIYKAAERSADLTRQLLAFARKQPVAPKVLNLNATVEKMLSMLKRLIGEDIDLKWRPGNNLGPVKIDPSQIDQILANLCINARDAIKGVGKVSIESDCLTFDESYCENYTGINPGEYVMIAVSDNGCGMSKSTLENIFEPFFSTKDVGEGSGLGLATVYGIVKQNKGFISVYSEPGQGTTFKIYLPKFVETIPAKETDYSAAAQKGNETILLVEDEEGILNMTRNMLERLGYKVFTATRPDDALRMVKGPRYSQIHLLITDVVMPEMNGRELSVKLTDAFPRLKCLFMSGYTEDVIAHHGVLESGVHFISKPFSMQTLAAKVREVLDEVK